jgi:hypothetical protein
MWLSDDAVFRLLWRSPGQALCSPCLGLIADERIEITRVLTERSLALIEESRRRMRRAFPESPPGED